jgi:hypothetical protein
MREYEERREIENFYEKAKKNIKKKIEDKGVSCKGSAKGTALSEIISVLDDELEIGMAEELVTARRLCREYYKKYDEVSSLERKISEKKEELEQQRKVVDLVSYLTDETLKNAIIAYNSINDNRGRYGNKEDARAIAIAYINSKGREDLKDVISQG